MGAVNINKKTVVERVWRWCDRGMESPLLLRVTCTLFPADQFSGGGRGTPAVGTPIPTAGPENDQAHGQIPAGLTLVLDQDSVTDTARRESWRGPRHSGG